MSTECSKSVTQINSIGIIPLQSAVNYMSTGEGGAACTHVTFKSVTYVVTYLCFVA